MMKHRLPATLAAALLLTASLFLATPVQAQKTAPAPPAAATPDRGTAYYHFGLANIYESLATDSGREDYVTQAVEEYKLALDADPDSTYLQTGLAELYFQVGRIREAIEAAQEQIKKDPNNLDAHLLLGRIYLRSLGDGNTPQSGEMLQLAITEYETIVQLQPDSMENHLLLGQLYALNHDSTNAEAQFKAAQAADPNSEEATLNLARLYSDHGDLPRAINILAAVPVTDRSAEMETALGALYDQTHQEKLAIETYRLALDQDPDNSDTRHALAQALLTDQQYDAALTEYNLILAAEPADASAYIRISDIQRHKGQYEDSLATLEKAKTLVHDPLDLNYIHYNEAAADEALDRNDAAVAILTAAIADTNHADGQYTEDEKGNRSAFMENLADVYRQMDKTDDAIAVYDKMIALGGDYAERGYQDEVDTWREVYEWQKATDAAAAAVKAMPKDSTIALVYASELADTGKPDDGIALAKAQLGTNGGKDDRTVHLALSQIYLRLKRWKDSAAELDAAEPLSQKPEDAEYLLYLRGALAERQKHYDEAEADFRKILATDPDSAMTLNYLGYMLADRGQKLDEAHTMIQKAVDDDPENGAYLDSLGWVYFKLGQYALAEETMHKAVARLRTDPTVRDHLGSVYEKEGKLSLAVAQWERSLAASQKSLPADVDPDDVAKVQKKLESAKVKLARESAPAH
ncbi:MAG TPA: tetratricopeptide repeat protein [Acidobacteriaceae bacterium]|jgi:tetratricopeptide (TPR) repeat protein|nr:tetratricopeptide repeat protein [Acidobacteriaceae bacterium]